jgi:hypothetical protein
MSNYGWHPLRSSPQPTSCRIIPFPVTARVRKIHETAVKLLDRPTAKSAEHYRAQVLEPMKSGFMRIGLSADEAEEQARIFWRAVREETARIESADAIA